MCRCLNAAARGISDVCSLEERDFYAAIKSIECG